MIWDKGSEIFRFRALEIFMCKDVFSHFLTAALGLV